MKWKTSISGNKDGELFIRGQKLTDLIANNTFTETIFLLLKGKFPDDIERELFDAVLVSMIEHSVAVPTGFVPRVVASTGNNLHTAIAAGALSVGDHHGGALENAMTMLQSDESPEEVVKNILARGERVPGFGHKLHKDADPRVIVLFEKARELGLSEKYIERVEQIGIELQKQSGKKLPSNVDSASAAILSEFGFDPSLGKALFAFARTPGMIAHAYEELTNEKPFRRFNDEDIEYIGE